MQSNKGPLSETHFKPNGAPDFAKERVLLMAMEQGDTPELKSVTAHQEKRLFKVLWTGLR